MDTLEKRIFNMYDENREGRKQGGQMTIKKF
jgi:hypothetical protein